MYCRSLRLLHWNVGELLRKTEKSDTGTLLSGLQPPLLLMTSLFHWEFVIKRQLLKSIKHNAIYKFNSRRYIFITRVLFWPKYIYVTRKVGARIWQCILETHSLLPGCEEAACEDLFPVTRMLQILHSGVLDESFFILIYIPDFGSGKRCSTSSRAHSVFLLIPLHLGYLILVFLINTQKQK